MFNLALELPDTCSRNELTRLHVLQAKIHLVNQQQRAAVEQMKRALEIDPYLVVDPFSHSPKVLKVLDQAREELKQEHRFPTADKVPVSTDVEPDDGHAEDNNGPVAWTLFGMGSAFAVGSGVTLALAYYEEAEQFDAADRKDRDARDEHYRNAKSYALAAGISGTVSAATLGAAFYWLWKDNRDRHGNLHGLSENVWIAPILTPDGTGVAVGIEF